MAGEWYGVNGVEGVDGGAVPSDTGCSDGDGVGVGANLVAVTENGAGVENGVYAVEDAREGTGLASEAIGAGGSWGACRAGARWERRVAA